jgi:hypothetical protein
MCLWFVALSTEDRMKDLVSLLTLGLGLYHDGDTNNERNQTYLTLDV